VNFLVAGQNRHFRALKWRQKGQKNSKNGENPEKTPFFSDFWQFLMIFADLPRSWAKSLFFGQQKARKSEAAPRE
jgi:hypothetical protein